MAFTPPIAYLGLVVSGDLGGLTIYTDKWGRKTAFPRQPPEVPRTPAQAAQRDAFNSAVASWRQLTPAQKQALEDATRTLSMPLTGLNLWISAVLRKDASAYLTVERQSGIELPPLPPP